jgi:amidase/aspartyl-tRNA(Asn)/glutamyl-tRNA(Gln) amidotransferase subunit A
VSLTEWQQLSPEAAAREVHQRVRIRLSPAQQRAVVACLQPEPTLAAAIAASREPAHAPLGGVPMFVKDLFDVRGTPTFAGSTFLPEVRPVDRDSALVSAATQAGLVFAGKTHLHEFAYGITGENPHYGDCERQLAPGRTSGGSSSGSAAAVAAGIVPVALGTDTGGSVRVPAAFCGVYGLRLTPGDRWIADAFSLSRSCDTAGWFTATAEDMRAVTNALLGPAAAKTALRGCYLPMTGIDQPVVQACSTAAAALTSPADATTAAELTAAFRDALFAYNTIVAIEAWDVHRGWAKEYASRYDPNVWQRLNRVHAITPDERARADQIWRQVGNTWRSFFETFDFLVLPATPTVALTKAECTAENRARLLTLTAPASVGGLPALTLPVPVGDSGLTAGLQVIAAEPSSPALRWALAVAEEQRGRVFV